MFSESHQSRTQYYKQKIKAKVRLELWVVLLYCSELMKICDQLIGGVKAGIPVCYRLVGIRQSAVKAKRSSSTACFELCH